MLALVGEETATNWFARTKEASKSEGELLTEVAGRICYKSFGVGLNPNVTKIRESSRDYIDNTLSKGDGFDIRARDVHLRLSQRQPGLHARACATQSRGRPSAKSPSDT